MSKNDFDTKRAAVVYDYLRSEKQKEIAKKHSVSLSTVKRIIRQHKNTGNVDRKKGSGRPPKISAAVSGILLQKVKENPKISTAKLAAQLAAEELALVSKETVRRELEKHNLLSCTAALKPLLTKNHLEARLKFASEMLRRPKSYIEKIIFSDESRFSMFQGDGKCRVWRKPGERYKTQNISPTVKFGGGSVMIWGCITYKGVGEMRIVDGTMDSITYTRILSDCLLTTACKISIENDFIFQQDNAPCHKSKFMKEYFAQNKIDVLQWPSQSPDLNPIENLWSYMKNELKKTCFKNKSELIQKLKIIWNEIPTIYVKKLYESLHKRCELVIRNGGGHIPY